MLLDLGYCYACRQINLANYNACKRSVLLHLRQQSLNGKKLIEAQMVIEQTRKKNQNSRRVVFFLIHLNCNVKYSVFTRQDDTGN